MKRITTRLSSVGPVLSTGLLGLLLLLSPRTVGAQTLPAQVGVDIVFPRDDTYPPADPFPIVFAFSGASAAWTYGFDFVWRTRRADGCQGQCGVVWSGQLTIEEGMFGGGVSFGEDDAYYLTTSSRWMGPGVDYEGGYALEWEFGFQRNCSMNGGTLLSTGGVVSASGTARFTIQREAAASGQEVRTQLEEKCPLAGGAVGIQEDLDGCPRLGGDVTADPCALDVPDDVVNYVVSALAATGGSAPAPITTSSALTSSSSTGSPATTTSTITSGLPTTMTTESTESGTITTTTNKPGETTSPVGIPNKSSSPSYGPSNTTTAVGLSTGSMTATSSSSAPSSTFPTVNAAPGLAGVIDFSEPVACFFLLLWGLWFV